MKKSLFYIAASLILFASCASDPKSEEKSIAEIEAENQTIEEVAEVETEPVPYFVDWKYKGFGHNLPESAERILELIEIPSEDKLLPVENGIVVDIEGKHFIKGLTAFASGSDADQSMNALASTFNVNLARYEQSCEGSKIEKLELVEDYWFELNSEYRNFEKPYIAVKVYEIELITDDLLESVNYYKYSDF